MIHAHLMNVAEPGCYMTELKATLEANSLPSIKIPRMSNSTKLLSTLSQIEKTDTNEEEVVTDDNKATAMNENLSREQTRTSEAERVLEDKISSKDNQLTFYTKESNDWPENITRFNLLKGIEEGKYKYTYTELSMEASKLFQHIINGAIIFDECFATVDDGTYRKIRSGRTMERTPPHREQRRASKASR